jgi:hypothetical protein
LSAAFFCFLPFVPSTARVALAFAARALAPFPARGWGGVFRGGGVAKLSRDGVVRPGMSYRGKPFGLPVLPDAVTCTATPCSARADEPTRGAGRVRYCWRCGLDVYDIASLSAADARAVMGLAEGAPCPALYVRRDGTVMKRDCPEGLRRNRVRRWLAVASAAVVLGGAVALPGVASRVRCGQTAARVRDRYEFVVRPFSDGAELVRVTRNARCRSTSGGAP